MGRPKSYLVLIALFISVHTFYACVPCIFVICARFLVQLITSHLIVSAWEYSLISIIFSVRAFSRRVRDRYSTNQFCFYFFSILIFLFLSFFFCYRVVVVFIYLFFFGKKIGIESYHITFAIIDIECT